MYPSIEVQFLVDKRLFGLEEAEARRRAKWDEFWGLTGAPERRGRARISVLNTVAAALTAFRSVTACLRIPALRPQPGGACAPA